MIGSCCDGAGRRHHALLIGDIRARLRWPFFGGYGCPLMSLGRDGVNRVPKYWCKPIANGATFNLYT